MRKVDRQFHWVHPDLYEIDLHGIPTLIVQFSVDHKLLGIHLGGCHVSSDGVDEMHKVHGLRFPGTAQWTEEALALFGYDPKPPADDRELLELNHDLAARLINICLVTALDAYYLLRRRAYAEQFDEAIEAAGIFGDDWPTDLGVDLGLVADPAFHLLHCAQRKVRRGQKDDAIEDINHALRLLGNAKSPAEDRALRLMRQALGKQSTEKHHKAKLREVFELFPEHDQLRREALDLLSEDPPIDGGEPAIEAPPTTVPPTLSVSTQPQPAPRPLRGRSYWTERADRNPLDD